MGRKESNQTKIYWELKCKENQIKIMQINFDLILKQWILTLKIPNSRADIFRFKQNHIWKTRRDSSVSCMAIYHVYNYVSSCLHVLVL